MSRPFYKLFNGGPGSGVKGHLSDFSAEEQSALAKHGFSQHPKEPCVQRRPIANPEKPNFSGGSPKFESISKHENGGLFISKGSSGYLQRHSDLTSALGRFGKIANGGPGSGVKGHTRQWSGNLEPYTDRHEPFRTSNQNGYTTALRVNLQGAGGDPEDAEIHFKSHEGEPDGLKLQDKQGREFNLTSEQENELARHIAKHAGGQSVHDKDGNYPLFNGGPGSGIRGHVSRDVEELHAQHFGRDNHSNDSGYYKNGKWLSPKHTIEGMQRAFDGEHPDRLAPEYLGHDTIASALKDESGAYSDGKWLSVAKHAEAIKDAYDSAN